MTLHEYQTLCIKSEPPYLTRGEEALLGLFGLNSSVGKLFDLYQKSLYEGAELAPEAFLEELGLVIRNVAILAHVVDKDIGDVLRRDVERLENKACEKRAEEFIKTNGKPINSDAGDE